MKQNKPQVIVRRPALQAIVFLSLSRWTEVFAQNSTLCCDVVSFEAEANSGAWDFSASISSIYEGQTGLSKYCDFFEVRTVPADGSNYTVLGTRVFGHDHPYEQPFTRAIRDAVLPDGITSVIALAHDSVDGYCGRTLELTLSANTPTSITATPTIQPPSSPPIQVVGSQVRFAPTVTSAPVLPTFPSLNPNAGAPSTVTSAPVTPPPISINATPEPASQAPIAVSAPNSILPSYIPSALPSHVPSSIPSDVPSPLRRGPTASSAPVLGLCVATVVAVVATAVV